MAQRHPGVFGGVDTHKHTHVAAVLDDAGRLLGTAAFDADTAGYAALLEWLRGHGSVERVGVEGTGSYGAGPRPQPRSRGRRRRRREPPQPPDAPPPRQDRHRRRGGSSAGRAQRRRRGGAQERRRVRRGDQDPRRGAPLHGQGPHRCRQPDRRCRRDRPRAPQRPPAGTEHSPHRGGLRPAATSRHRQRSCARRGQAGAALPGPPPPGAHRGDQAPRRRAAPPVRTSQPGAAGRSRRRR